MLRSVARGAGRSARLRPAQAGSRKLPAQGPLRQHKENTLLETAKTKVIEVFRRCGSREIPAKNFRDLWNCFFPHEKLQCKDSACSPPTGQIEGGRGVKSCIEDYGYRDVKGLLANIPVVEKARI